MELYIYSDESGVFDKLHNDYYIYGGLIFLEKDDRDKYTRIYLGAEANIGKAYAEGLELKACFLKNKHKAKLYSAVKPCVKFGAVVRQADVIDKIFDDKKSKQRYLDYVYKMALKNAFCGMQKSGVLDFTEVTKLNIFVDEHTTATNGIYELRESLIQEFKIGTFNFNYNTYFPPIFENLQEVELRHCNSSKKPLIRAADILANRLYYCVTHQKTIDCQSEIYIKYFP